MSTVPERFIALVVIVSGLAVLAASLLIKQVSAFGVVAGAVLAALALFGIVVLARAVVIVEREGGRR